MIKIKELNPNLNSNINSKKPIFLSKQGEKKTNKELDIHLFNKILYSFEILTLVLQKLFYKMGILYTKLLCKIKNVNFDIKKIPLSLNI